MEKKKRQVSAETCKKLHATWMRSPPERVAKWNAIRAEWNARKRQEIENRTQKKCSTCKNVKGFDEFAKNKTSADGRSTVCLECRRSYDRLRYEKKGHQIRLRVKNYRKNNLPKVNAADAAKIKRRKLATPKWINVFQWAMTEEFYELTAAKTVQTAIKHHVDHIVPIKGKNVSGLNVPWNLQVLPAKVNLQKHASFTQE